MSRPAKLKRNTIIRNLNQMGCTIRSISEGFEMSTHRVQYICSRGAMPNPCRKHRHVVAHCRECRRSGGERIAS